MRKTTKYAILKGYNLVDLYINDSYEMSFIFQSYAEAKDFVIDMLDTFADDNTFEVIVVSGRYEDIDERIVY